MNLQKSILEKNNISNLIEDVKKDFGIYFTPDWVIEYMISLIDTKYENCENIRILEPACGIAQFLSGLKKFKPSLFNKANKIGVEINNELILHIRENYLDENINIFNNDYLLWDSDKHFDIIIGNPPYGIPSLSDHYTIKVDNETKSKYKELFSTWFGKYNLYGAFIEKSIRLLKDNGQLIFIVPATFMILDEFKKLRKFLSRKGNLDIIFMGSDVFKPDADVSSVILNFIKRKEDIGKYVLYEYKKPANKIKKAEMNWKGEIIYFETDFTKKLNSLTSHKLGDIFNIKISPRTTEIKSNEYVLDISKEISDDYIQILNGKNLKCNEINYNLKSGYWIRRDKLNRFRGYFTKPHIVIGLGFRENGKIGASFDKRCSPWMGDVYHLIKKYSMFNSEYDLTEEDLIEYLNSDYVRKYIKDMFKDITYHLSITQLKAIPIPTKSEFVKLKEEFLWKETGKQN